MHLTKVKHLLLLAGLMAAGPAWAGTLTVYPTMIGAQAAASPADPKYGAYYAVGQVQGGTIDCPTNYTAGMVGKACVAEATGTVALVASPVSNAVAIAWAGCPAAAISTTTVANDTCTLTMGTEPQTVEASFKPALYPLELLTLGKMAGAGVPAYAGYLSTGGGICQTFAAAPNDVCDQWGTNGSVIPVVATPGPGERVTNWTGCTSVDVTGNVCTVALTSPKGVSATFGPVGIPVNVQLANFGGSGTVTAAVAGQVVDGMNCPGDCSAQVTSGGAITLTATATGGSKFLGFTGCGATPTTVTQTCVMSSVTAAKEITATFKPGGSCHACHANPPSTHQASWMPTGSCAPCHGAGYTNQAVNPATHMDGTLAAPPPPAYPPPAPSASLGINFEIQACAIDAVTKVASCDVKLTDAAGTARDPRTMYNTADGNFGSSGAPRFSIGEIGTDGTFTPKLGTSTLTTSETSNAARWTATATPDVYRYTFAATVGRAPTDFSRQYRAVVYGTVYNVRAGYPSVQYPNADYFEFVPDGGAGSTAVAEVVSNAACNACHGQLTLHGRRRNVAICLTCHNPNTPLGNATTGPNVANTDLFRWDLKNLVHKLHSGKNYGSWDVAADGTRSNFVQPTKPDGTTGTGWFSENSTTHITSVTMDASHMKMGPSHSTYFEGADGATIVDAGLMGNECGICHQGANASRAYTRPTRNGCGSCHDGVNFATGHDSAGAQTNDSGCATCHGEAWTRQVHSGNYESSNNANFGNTVTYQGVDYAAIPAAGHDFRVAISSVVVDGTGAATITLDATLDGAPFNLLAAATIVQAAPVRTNDSLGGRLATCAITIAGPTSDYVLPATGGTTQGCTTPSATVLVSTGTPGQYTVKTGTFFAGKNVTGAAYTLSYEIMYQRQMTVAAGTVRKPFSANPPFITVYWDGSAWQSTVRGSGTAADLAKSRRAVVSFDKCNNCHVDLGFHSNRSRKGPDYCAECHNPKLDNGTRARALAADAYTTGLTGTALVYLPESVSMNVFIHRIHMGGELASVADPDGTGPLPAGANASPWVPEPGRIVFGATRSAFVGVTATTAPELADFTEFAMPNDMGRCDQCHISNGAQKTWALNENPGLAPIERTFRVCTPATVSWDSAQWCNNTATSGMPTTGAGLAAAVKVVTPPLKAVCASCHDSLAADTHMDLGTINPMTGAATELCASCHGAGATWDSLVVHPAIP